MSGFLLIHKQAGCTSFDIVKKIQNLTKAKAGHAGTLDPFASGFLVVAIGKATRLIEYVMRQDKEYIFEVTWGKATDTDDSTGKVIANSEKIPSLTEIKSQLSSFIGEINQVPPIYSAIKIKGKKAYEYARSGEILELAPRKIKILEFELLEHQDNKSRFRVACGKGSYIRALARDLAESLSSKAFVSSLERLIPARFNKKNMIDSSEIFAGNLALIKENLLDMNEMLNFLDNFALNKEKAIALSLGKKLTIKDLPFTNHKPIRLTFHEDFIGLALYSSGILKPQKIINNASLTT